MSKRAWIAGILGGLVMMVWLVVSNAILPIKSDMIHRVPAQQIALHAALSASITEPGTYSCPYMTQDMEGEMPDYRDQPVYSITYSGMTHGEGSPLSATPFIAIFASALIAAWLLAKTSAEFRGSFLRRFLFVAALGLLIALYDDVLQMSFGPQPKDYLLFLAINNLITWSLAGLVIAWRLRPEPVR